MKTKTFNSDLALIDCADEPDDSARRLAAIWRIIDSADISDYFTGGDIDHVVEEWAATDLSTADIRRAVKAGFWDADAAESADAVGVSFTDPIVRALADAACNGRLTGSDLRAAQELRLDREQCWLTQCAFDAYRTWLDDGKRDEHGRFCAAPKAPNGERIVEVGCELAILVDASHIEFTERDLRDVKWALDA